MTRPYLGNPKYTIEVLQKYGFVFQKRFGQNFLIDTRVLDRIIEASEITKDDFVLEIGPGIGTMTQYLADAAREVTAVEIDDALIPILQDTLKEWDNVSVIHGDILKTDIRKIAVYRTGDVVRVEVEGAGRGDIPAAVKAAKERDTEDAE